MDKRLMMLIILTVLTVGVACQSAAPATPSPTSVSEPTVAASTSGTALTPTISPTVILVPTAVPTPTRVPAIEDGLQTLLSYVSSGWVDLRGNGVLGPYLIYLDIAHLRTDLALPPVTGADEYKVKANLITKLDTIGFGPTPLRSKLPDAFKTWGWDIADVDQLLNFSDDGTFILLGNFARPEITARLAAQGYRVRISGDFSIYSKDERSPYFAVKSDTLIISSVETVVDSLVDRKTNSRPGLDQQPAIKALLTQLEGQWGVILGQPGNMAEYARWLKLQDAITSKSSERLKQWLSERVNKEPEAAWDVMAIGWQGLQPTNMLFLFHYPSRQEANNDVALVKASLTEAPIFMWSKTWGDIWKLKEIKVQDRLLFAAVSTDGPKSFGTAFWQGEWGFVPLRSMAKSQATLPELPTSDARTSAYEAGWTLYTKEADGFAIALPSDWLQVDLNAKTIDTALQQAAKQNPELSKILANEVRQAAAVGFKFLGVEVPPLTSPRYGFVAVMKSAESINLPLETIARVLFNQTDALPTILKPAKLQKVQLSAGEAWQLKYQEKMTITPGEPREASVTQYLLLGGKHLYAISFAAMGDVDDARTAIYDKIMQSFQLVK